MVLPVPRALLMGWEFLTNALTGVLAVSVVDPVNPAKASPRGPVSVKPLPVLFQLAPNRPSTVSIPGSPAVRDLGVARPASALGTAAVSSDSVAWVFVV